MYKQFEKGNWGWIWASLGLTRCSAWTSQVWVVVTWVWFNPVWIVQDFEKLLTNSSTLVIFIFFDKISFFEQFFFFISSNHSSSLMLCDSFFIQFVASQNSLYEFKSSLSRCLFKFNLNLPRGWIQAKLARAWLLT